MRALDAGALVLFFASAAGATQVRGRQGGGGGSRTQGGVTLPGATARPARVELNIPALGQGLAAGPQAPEAKAAVGPAPPSSLEARVLSVRELGPGIAPVLPPSVIAAVVLPRAPAGPSQDPAEAPAGPPEVEGGPALAKYMEAQVLFDQAAREVPRDSGGSWFSRLRAKLFPDVVPAWPGKTGDRVRINGRSYILGEKIGEGGASIVYRVQGHEELVLKFIYPDMKGDPHYGQEVLALQALSYTDIAHSKLKDHGADGTILVKGLVHGQSLKEALDAGSLRESQTRGLADLAAKLIRIGYTADLVPANLSWDHWRTAWFLVDAGGFRMAPPLSVLGQLLGKESLWGSEPLAAKAAFLGALRGRLGPDSAAWAQIREDSRGRPWIEKALAELSRQDAARPPPPRGLFGPSKDAASLPDTLLSARDARRALGYDPLGVKDARKLHGDDPGKLNTQVHELRPAGAAPRVRKIAEIEIIRRELAVRRIIRRWFGRHFATPASVAFVMGHEGVMVMERSQGGPYFARNTLTLTQRVALGVLARGFGLWDMNQGNILLAPGSLPVLIDFEQAFGSSEPVPGRIPHEGIALEMPWVSLHEPNAIEDYYEAIREWRVLFSKPETRAELAALLKDSGYPPDRARSLLDAFAGNVSRLEWTLLSDVEFANGFVGKKKG